MKFYTSPKGWKTGCNYCSRPVRFYTIVYEADWHPRKCLLCVLRLRKSALQYERYNTSEGIASRPIVPKWYSIGG